MLVLTQARLKELLHYDPKTGVFTWLVRPSNNVKVGDIAGSRQSAGYWQIRINGAHYLSHRLAWLYMRGYLPEQIVDHINGMRNDTRWCNLRHVSATCNLQNCKIQKNNTSGYTGVSFHKQSGRWKAEIGHQGKSYFLGFHNTVLDAALARIAVEDCLPDFHCDSRCENRKKVFNALRGIQGYGGGYQGTVT